MEGLDPCGEPLVSEKVVSPVRRKTASLSRWLPIRTYPFRSLKTWITELLQRTGVEEMVTDSWASDESSESWSDVMHAPGIREFLGPDGKTRFSVRVGDDLHLVFSMFVDWFNPYGNKQAGKSHSIGAIYLCCLNLPPHIRFRPENIYLAGIIPGPGEPELHQINHIL
ncbi:hypothetical protein OH76DRAFT_1365994, partial [Lentinus brumalis]